MDLCEEHMSGAGPLLPCAWPGCANGTDGDTISDRLGVGSERLTWERASLDSADGRRRYFWHNPEMGWWEGATQLRNHELSRIQRPLNTGKYVYHYTTVAALKSIVETQEVWLTDYAYLNDSSEIRHGLQLALEEFDAAVSGATPETAAVLRKLLDIPASSQPRICVACFSYGRDSLTQWKGYGGDTVGVAIGVEPPAFLQGLALPRELSAAPVVYDPQAKRALLHGFFHDWAALRDRDLARGQVQEGAYETLPRGSFLELLSVMKDEAFRDEQECRFVYQEHPDGPIVRFDGKARKRFRMAGDILAPYTTTRDLSLRSAVFDARESRLAIHEVVVGPHPHAELIRAGIRELLDASGYESVEVALSTVPFR